MHWPEIHDRDSLIFVGEGDDPSPVQFEPDDNGNHKNRRATCGEKHNQWQIQSAHYKQSLQLIKISGLDGPGCHANVQRDARQWKARRPEGGSHRTFSIRFLPSNSLTSRQRCFPPVSCKRCVVFEGFRILKLVSLIGCRYSQHNTTTLSTSGAKS